MSVRVFTGLVLMCCHAAAAAQSARPAFEITPFGGYRFGGAFNVADEPTSYKLDDAGSFGVIVNFPHRTNTNWEILYSRQSADAEFDAVTINDALVDVDLQVLQLGGTYEFEGDSVLPYLAATIGATHADVRSRGSASDTYWSASLGLGLLVSPSSRVGLRLEARAYSTFMNSGTDIFCKTGPDLNVCAVRLEGDILTQVETFAGVVIRF